MFTQQIMKDLVAFGCNVQWFELMKTCRKMGTENDASNLTRAIELFIFHFTDFISENRFELPVDFVSRCGDLEMFLTFMKLAGFDINDTLNHPIVKNKMIPYAANNRPIATYLIAKMDMEFRISLLENALDEHDANLVRTVLSLVTPAFYNLGVATLFEQRRLQELFLSRKCNYSVVSQRIMHFLDLKALFVFRSASKKFQIAVDREKKMWAKIYSLQKNALKDKIKKISENVEKVPVQWANADLNAIVFLTAQWKEFIKKIENMKNLRHTRYLCQIYYRINEIIKVTNLIPLNFQQWIRVQRWHDLVSPISFCLCVDESSTELFFKLILPHLDIPASEISDHNVQLIQRVIASENLELVKVVEPYINLDLTLRQGSNVFHLAAQFGTIEIFKYLIKNAKAADPRLQNNSTDTPYDLARSDEMKEYLESVNLN